MASWKKVIVSGSIAELNVVTASAFYVQPGQVLGSPTNTIISGAFSGSFSGSFFGNGSALTNVTATSFTIPNTSTDIVQASDYIVISQSNGFSKITYQNFLTDLTNGANSNLVVDTSNDGIALNATIAGLTSVTATSFTGSILGSHVGNTTGTASWASNVNGTIFNSNNPALSASYAATASTAASATQVANNLTAGGGINSFTYNGSSAQTVAIKSASVFQDNAILKWDTGGNQFESSSLNDNGTIITGNTSIQLTGATSVLTGSFTGSFTGDGSNLTGVGANVTSPGDNRILTSTGTATGINAEANLTFDGTALTNTGATSLTGFLTVGGAATFNNQVNLNLAGSMQSTVANPILFTAGTTNTSVTIGNPTNSTVTIGNNLTINGNLVANGSSSFINSTNLLVQDRFATFASGANASIDGGIIVQNSTSPAGTGSGFAFYIETGINAPRWAITSSLNNNATSGQPDEYMVTAKLGSSAAPTVAPTWGGTDGIGNIYVQNNANNDIWIYS